MNVIVVALFGFGHSGRVRKIIDNVFPMDDVKIITSDFNHGEKSYFSKENVNENNVLRLHVPSYKRNLSFKRIYSHLHFACSLKKYLKNLDSRPDLVYCAMPTSSAAYVAGKYCNKHNIPFIIDVIDLWPDSLIPIVPLKKLIDILVSPWRWMTHRAYKMADYISGESKKYSELAHMYNPSVPFSYTYLGVDYTAITQLVRESNVILEKPKNEIWIAYGGSLGQSYDFDVILEGLKVLQENKIPYKMWFVGDGEKAEYINEYSNRYNLNVEITGILPYKDLLKCLSYCDIAINPFKEGTLVVHSYKFNDYIASGCFVLNNLPGETADMIEKYKVGANFNIGSFNSVLLNTIKEWDTFKLHINDHLDNLRIKELDTTTIYSSLRRNILESL